MRLVTGYPIFITNKLTECRSFYERLGFSVVFEASWFLFLSSGGDAPFSLAFMSPEHPSSPPDPRAFAGDGSFLTLQVEDASASHDELKKKGFKIEYPLRDEPWGQRRFGIVDPAGIWVDVVEQTEPAPRFWDPYMTGQAPG